MDHKKNIRIIDIAQMAEVSVGTVDRILHGRGKVSPEKRERVEAILKEVNYHPNMIARSLALKKQFVAVALIPNFQPGEYWEQITEGIDRAATELMPYNIIIEKIYFDQYNKDSFTQAIKQLFTSDFDGVLIGTLFTDQVITLSKELDEQHIPYVYIDSIIPGQRPLSYFGTNSYDGGYIAAKLLTEKISTDSDILVARIARNNNNDSTQFNHRKDGFYDYLKKIGFAGNLYNCDLKIDDSVHNTKILDALFTQHPHIQGAILFNSACYVLADYLKERRKEVKLVGYDLIARNTKHLIEGNILYLIAQRPEMQGYNGIKCLGNLLLSGTKVSPVNFMPIDILIKENISYYNNNNL